MAIIVANGPAQTTATIAKQAEGIKQKVVSEKILTDKILTSTGSIIPLDKFRLGADNKIDTTISFDTGEWKGAFRLKGMVADTGTLVYSSHLDREFKFTDGHQVSVQDMEFSGDSLAWLGLMGEVASIKMTPQVVDADGKLTMTLTATDPFSKVRALVFRDGEALEIHYNDGSTATDSSCIVQFLNVERPLSGDVNFTLRLLKDFEASGGAMVNPASPLIYPPNLDLWMLTEKGEKSWPQNYMELTVQDTVRFMLATSVKDVKTGKYHYEYSQKQAVQALNVNLAEEYNYPGREGSKYPGYFYWAYLPAKAFLYELGMRDSTGKGAWITGKGYVRGGSLLDSMNGLPVFVQTDNWEPKILFGDITTMYTPPYVPKANFFLPVKINNMRKERFAVMPWTGTTGDKFNVEGQKLVTLEFERANNDNNASYYLKGDQLEYVRYSFDSTKYEMVFTPFGYGTDTTMDHNVRVQIIDNRHVKIMDNNPVSWAGERYWMTNSILRPYDTATPTGVNEQPEILTPALSVYPNPAFTEATLRLGQPAPREMEFRLYNPLGLQMGAEIPIPSGETEAKISLEGLPAGVYYLKAGRYGLIVSIIKVP